MVTAGTPPNAIAPPAEPTRARYAGRPIRIKAGDAHPLHDVAATRAIEHALTLRLGEGVLMRRAGISVARLALALAPHARQMWIACGPGNNGGDGLEAAAVLRGWGLDVTVSLFGRSSSSAPVSGERATALDRARAAGVRFVDAVPTGLDAHDLCIDALLGIGQRTGHPGGQRAPNRDTEPNTTASPTDWLPRAIGMLGRSAAPVLAIDVPTGLNAETGVQDADLIAEGAGPRVVSGTFRCQFTLSLLTLKPGLFTADGQDAAGEVWFDDLQDEAPGTRSPHQSAASAPIRAEQLATPCAYLNPTAPRLVRPAASHKGLFGDVAVIGGEGIARRGMGMRGAAVLAATAAASSGAGRVLLALLGDDIAADAIAPPAEIMLRRFDALDLGKLTAVCGCGGGEAVESVLVEVLEKAMALVLDADALNAIARSPDLQRRVAERRLRAAATILTPHPLEAARLLGGENARQVQADRLAATQALVQRYGAVVVLKGSGSVIGGPGRVPVINLSGNGRLATAGTGDVLAGMAGAALAAQPDDAFAAAAAAVWRHGDCADRWPAAEPLTAGVLARRV